MNGGCDSCQGNVDGGKTCGQCGRRGPAGTGLAPVPRETEPRRCTIYDSPCVSPEVCADTRACCAGSPPPSETREAPKAGEARELADEVVLRQYRSALANYETKFNDVCRQRDIATALLERWSRAIDRDSVDLLTPTREFLARWRSGGG